MIQEWSQPNHRLQESRRESGATKEHPKGAMKMAWGTGWYLDGEQKAGKLFCAEEQSEDGLLGWCLRKMASHLNLTSMWRREKTRREAVSSTQLTWRVERQIVGRTTGWWKSWQLGHLKVRPEHSHSLASRMHQAHSLVRALRVSLSSVWYTLPTHCPFFFFTLAESYSSFRSEYNCHFLKEVCPDLSTEIRFLCYSLSSHPIIFLPCTYHKL